MQIITKLIGKYDAAIWVRFHGTLLTKVAQFMMYPFLALYLNQHLDGTIIIVSIILGLESFAGFIMNLLFGGLSDRFGRKPLMLISLAVQGFAMVGLIFASSLWEVAVLITIMGAGSYIFFPAADAQIADMIPENKRSEIYSLLSLAANIGITIGPILGLFLFTSNPAVGFGFFAVVSFIYFGLVMWKIPETLPSSLREKAKAKRIGGKDNANHNKLTSKEFMALSTFTILAVPTSLFAAQMWASLPFYLKENFDNFNEVLMVIMVSRALFSISLQMMVGKRTENLNSSKVILVGFLLYGVAAFGFGFSLSIVALVLFTLINAVAGMLAHIHMQKVVSIWAPDNKRGRYFSIFGLHWRISEMIGPVIGGVIFTYLGGEMMFISLGIMLIVAGVFQYYYIQKIIKSQYMTKKDDSLQLQP